MLLYTSDTHLRQKPYTILDILGTYENIFLVVLYPLSKFYATYEKASSDLIINLTSRQCIAEALEAEVRTNEITSL